MVSLKEKLRARRLQKEQPLEAPTTLQCPAMTPDETPAQQIDRHRALKRFARAAEARELPRWEGEKGDCRLTMLETETAASILATNPDIDLIQVLRCIGVPGPGFTRDLIYPLSYRVRDAIESRARRIRTTLQNLQPGEIHQISVNYLASVIDDESAGHRVRIKAVEALAKLATAAQKGQDDKTADPVTVSELVQEIRAKVLGVTKVD